MFDGSFKASRKVNLSGRKKPSVYGTTGGGAQGLGPTVGAAAAGSKEELLQQTKLLREERLAHRRRTTASLKIQALYRRVRVTRHARWGVFTELEVELTALVTTTDLRQRVVPIETLWPLLSKFLFAYGRRGPNERGLTRPTGMTAPRVRKVQDYIVFMLLANALRPPSAASNARTVLVALVQDPRWRYQLTRILEIALEVLVRTRFGTPAEQLTSPYVLLFGILTDRERLMNLGIERPLVESAHCKLLAQLASGRTFGTFEALQELVRQGRDPHADDRVAEVIANVTAHTLMATSDSGGEARNAFENPTARAFVRTVIGTPCAIGSRVTRTVIQSISQSIGENSAEELLWSASLPRLIEDQALLKWDARAIVVGNLVDLLRTCAFAPTITAVATPVISSLVTMSHFEWAFEVDTTSEQVAVLDVDMDDDEQHPTLVQVEQRRVIDIDEQASMQEGIQALDSALKAVQAQWQVLCEPSFLATYFEAAESGTILNHISRVYTTFLFALGRAYLLTVRQSFKTPPSAVFTFLSAVGSSHNASPDRAQRVVVLSRLWKHIKLTAASTTFNLNNATREQLEDLCRPIMLFNVIYSHMLLLLDDETFYDRSWPFAIHDVLQIVLFLKRFIYETCWNVSSSAARQVTTEFLLPSVTSAVKLFNQLYDRDCRRHFALDDTWLWPSMPIIKETVDLETMEGELYDIQALSTLMNGAALPIHSRASLILTTIPQVFSFNDRVQLFEKLLDDERQRMVHIRDEFSRAIQVRIKRDEIVDESFEFFQQICETKSPSILKSRIKVTFINEQGLEEAGIDGGGVFKEYVDVLTKSAFSPEYGFFLATNDQLLYPNPSARVLVESHRDLSDRFRFLGRVLGKAVYESILVEPQFAAFFLNKLLGKVNYIDDLHSLDPDLYKNLMQLKHYSGDIEDLALTFSVDETEFGKVITRNLIADGANIPVTKENRLQYIHLLANYKLNVLSSGESAAFLRGFRDLIPAKWLQMFSPSELQMLIGGTATKIDLVDWQRHTVYAGGYHPSQPIIQWFWEIVEVDFTPEDRAALLKFITSCSRPPLLGFGQLAPQICIHQVRITDDDRLPSSATCMNLLKLPTYSSKAIMRDKLLYAIRANAGFDLS